MKIMFLADPHFHGFKQHSTVLEDGSNSRLMDIIGACRGAVEEAEKKGCECLMIPGDIFHVRGVVKPSVFNVVFNFMAEIAKKMRVIIIPGNHDMENYATGYSAVDTLDWINNVDVIKTPRGTITMVDGLTVLGIPYHANTEDFKDVYARVMKENRPDITLIHQGVDDFAGGGYPETGLTASFLEENGTGMIFSGHYHSPGQRGRVVMVGAPIQHTFSDEGSARGYWILDTGLDSLSFHDITGTPMFVTVTDPKAAFIDGNFIRVKASDLKTADKIREKCMAAGAKSVVVELVREFATAHEETIKINTPKQMLIDFIDMKPEYKPHKAGLLEMYERICT